MGRHPPYPIPNPVTLSPRRVESTGLPGPSERISQPEGACIVKMICGNAKVGPGCKIGPSAVVQPLSTVTRSTLGEGCILEEKCLIENSTIGDNNLIEVGSQLISCTIGNANEIHPRCRLSNCKIGNNCVIGVEVVLEEAEVPDQTSVVTVNGELRILRNERTAMSPLVGLYRSALSDTASPQCLAKNHPVSSAP